jgi:hypothetical protein
LQDLEETVKVLEKKLKKANMRQQKHHVTRTDAAAVPFPSTAVAAPFPLAGRKRPW